MSFLCVFFYEVKLYGTRSTALTLDQILNSPDKACQLAKQAFDVRPRDSHAAEAHEARMRLPSSTP